MIDNFAILQMEALADVWPVQGGIERNHPQTMGILLWKKMGEKKKQRMVKVATPYHQAAWKQKTCQKRNVNF